MIAHRPAFLPSLRALSARLPRVGRKMVSLAVIGSLLVPTLPLKSAQASHYCMIACMATAPTGWPIHQQIVEGAIDELDIWIGELLADFIDAVVKYANQGSNNEQNLMNSMSAMQDHQDSSGFASDMSESVVAAANEIRPSATGCATNQNTNKLMGIMLGLTSGTASYLPSVGTSARSAMATAESNTFNVAWANAAGTAGEKGRLDYMTDRYSQRIARYNNNASTGLASAPSIAADADLMPIETIMAKANLSAANDLTAAQDVVFNLAGDAVQDPVRGQALIRSDGRSTALRRNQEAARLNLSSTILMGMVERRRNNTTTGKSEQEFNAETSSYTASASRALAEAKSAAEEGKSANLDRLIAMIGDSSRQLFMVQTFMEQWAALKAVSLAIDVKSNSAGSAGVAGRTINQ